MSNVLSPQARRIIDTDYSRTPTIRAEEPLLPPSIRTEGEWEQFLNMATAIKLPGQEQSSRRGHFAEELSRLKMR